MKPNRPKLQTLKPMLATADLSIGTKLTETQKRSNRSKAYNYRWQQARLRHLAKEPMCVNCKLFGYVTVATVVDHRVPHRGDQRLFWDESNWDSLCKRCHDSKTGRGE